MKKATRIFAYLGVALGFGFGLLMLILALLGFIGAFKYLPPIVSEDSRTVFHIFLLMYGIFMILTGLLSLHHYFNEDKKQRDVVYSVFIIILSVFALNLFSLISGILSLIMDKNKYLAY